MIENYPDNEEVLSAYSDSLSQCRTVVPTLPSRLQHDIEELKNGTVSLANARVVLANRAFQVKVAEAALRARAMNLSNGETLMERWNAAARDFASFIAPMSLIEATTQDAKEFYWKAARGPKALNGIEVLLGFLRAYKAEYKRRREV